MTEEHLREKHPDDRRPDDEHLPDEVPPEEQPGAIPPHLELPPYWSELFKNIPKIDLPRLPINIPRVPKFDIPYMPKIELPKVEVSSTFAEEIARISEQARAALANIAYPIERFTVQLPRIPAVPQHVIETLQQVGRVAAEAWERGMPRNWKGFEFEEIEATIARVRATGFSLAWLPQTDVLREVLAAPEEDTAAVLLAHRDEVVADMSACLDETLPTAIHMNGMPLSLPSQPSPTDTRRPHKLSPHPSLPPPCTWPSRTARSGGSDAGSLRPTPRTQ